MNRRQFLFAGLRGAVLGAAITSGLALTRLPEVSFVRGRLMASDITKAKLVFRDAERKSIEIENGVYLVTAGSWSRA